MYESLSHDILWEFDREKVLWEFDLAEFLADFLIRVYSAVRSLKALFVLYDTAWKAYTESL